MDELNVTMLGPSGVGKTTLLAAMYEQFNAVLASNPLQLIPHDDAASTLMDRLVELKTLANEFAVRGGNPPTRKPFEYRFGIGKKGASPTAELRLWDYPGEFHLGGNGAAQSVREHVANAAVVLLPVDAPALVEEGGRWHDMVNRPQQMADVFRASYQDLADPRLVILTAVKCEKYVSKPPDAQRLAVLMRERYRDMFGVLTCDALRSQVGIVICPVQTVGSVVFSRIEMDGDYPKFIFKKRKYDAPYAPVHGEQPLRYLLRFLLELHKTNRGRGIMGWLRTMFGTDKHLAQAVEEFARGCKTGDGFEIVQNNGYLG